MAISHVIRVMYDPRGCFIILVSCPMFDSLYTVMKPTSWCAQHSESLLAPSEFLTVLLVYGRLNNLCGSSIIYKHHDDLNRTIISTTLSNSLKTSLNNNNISI